jgi:hypothetical protein
MEHKFESLFNEHDNYEQLTIDDEYEEWLAKFERKKLDEEIAEITTTTRRKSL